MHDNKQCDTECRQIKFNIFNQVNKNKYCLIKSEWCDFKNLYKPIYTVIIKKNIKMINYRS